MDMGFFSHEILLYDGTAFNVTGVEMEDEITVISLKNYKF